MNDGAYRTRRAGEARVVVFACSDDGLEVRSFTLRAFAQARDGIERDWEIFNIWLEGDLMSLALDRIAPR